MVTNHVTVNGIDGRWTPSLGASWGHWCTNRLYLYRKRQFRFGFLFKSTESSQSTPVQFCIKVCFFFYVGCIHSLYIGRRNNRP